MGLHNLPYDVLLNISEYLGLDDISALQLTCKSLHLFAITRPVVRGLALDLLRRCRPLPLQGFQNIYDLATSELKRSVRKAAKLEQGWRTRCPRPVSVCADRSWYKTVSTPPGEEVEWLSPITMSYMLCSTKSGKVVCWDVDRDACLGSWDPGEGWVLWKCRAAYEEQAVYFTMGKDISDSHDEHALELVLMKLHIPGKQSAAAQSTPAAKPLATPTFTSITKFKTSGMVLNVFILNHVLRILSAYIWLPGSNTIGLYVIPDWSRDDYIFIDTTITCHPLANWSCVYSDDQVVILCEESECTTQYFYPISILQHHSGSLRSKSPEPIFRTGSIPPSHCHKTRFVFPQVTMSFGEVRHSPVVAASDTTQPSTVPSSTPSRSRYPNPCPSPPWYPDSAHFVRQWWPAFPSMPHISCTVILLAGHDPTTHRTMYTLTQHYLTVATTKPSEVGEGQQPPAKRLDLAAAEGADVKIKDTMDENNCASLKVWYAGNPFEVVCITDGAEEADDTDTQHTNYRPLIAVDFGHAAWVEYEVDADQDDERLPEKRVLRFVTFPSIDADPWEDNGGMAKFVSTLEVPAELDLSCVETINIDQSQGAIIVSVSQGKVFILFYE